MPGHDSRRGRIFQGVRVTGVHSPTVAVWRSGRPAVGGAGKDRRQRRRGVSILVWHFALTALVALRAAALVAEVVFNGKFGKKIWHELF